MIIGFGTYIIETARIDELVKRRGEDALERVFSPAELAKSKTRGKAISQFRAGRWAVKEAFYKALPLFTQAQATWKSIEVLSEMGTGKPKIYILSSELKEFFQLEHITSFQVSISHERSICTAIVILE